MNGEEKRKKTARNTKKGQKELGLSTWKKEEEKGGYITQWRRREENDLVERREK